MISSAPLICSSFVLAEPTANRIHTTPFKVVVVSMMSCLEESLEKRSFVSPLKSSIGRPFQDAGVKRKTVRAREGSVTMAKFSVFSSKLTKVLFNSTHCKRD